MSNTVASAQQVHEFGPNATQFLLFLERAASITEEQARQMIDVFNSLQRACADCTSAKCRCPHSWLPSQAAQLAAEQRGSLSAFEMTEHDYHVFDAKVLTRQTVASRAEGFPSDLGQIIDLLQTTATALVAAPLVVEGAVVTAPLIGERAEFTRTHLMVLLSPAIAVGLVDSDL